MSSKKQPFHFRILKARISETLIKELFKINNYNVFNFGMEEVMPGIVGSLNTNNSAEARQIRQLPDFVIQNKIDGSLHYVEVKYRHNCSFRIEDLGKDYKYTNAFFIIVHKEGIGCISYNDLNRIGFLPEEDIFKLEGQQEFKFSATSIKEFKNYAKMFFQGVE